MNFSKLLLPGAALAALLSACGPATVAPELSVSPSPRIIDGMGQASKVKITATDDKGKPGTGTVRVSSTAGSLKAGLELTLANGEAETDFTCDRATDATCTGSVRISAEWTAAGMAVTASASVQVTPPPVEMDAGIDAGMRLDAGVFDGGVAGDYALQLTTAKTNLIAAATDSSDVVIRLFTNSVGMVPVSAPVNLTLTGGASFSASGPMATTTVTTSAGGTANVTVHVGTAVGPFSLFASALDAAQTLDFNALNARSIAWKADSTTITTLNIASTGITTSTPVFFEVRDSDNMPVPGVDVSFSIDVGSAAGCSVAPTRAATNMAGLARTTLSTGDSQGTATVIARVTGLPDARSTGFAIVIGKPSDSKLQVTCARKTLGALQSANPPRIDQGTVCTASFADRNSVKPNYAVSVTWQAEAGQVDPTSNGMPASGFALTNFNTSGSLPVATTPLPGEPSNGGNNPRDGFVTVIAAMTGEEQFWDGSGLGGVVNGRWDPGEWFVDLPEPFVDSNDNGRYDFGESFIDTDRTDCATGANLGKNGVWDGPNGCWDRNTQIWASTHIVYAGSLVSGTPNSTYVSVTPPFPSLVLLNSFSSHNVVMSDGNFNRLSSDGIGASVQTFGMARGTVSVSTSPAGGESFGGHAISYSLIRATETSPGVFNEEGTCDQSIPDAGYPATRCFHSVKFTGWLSTPTTTVLAVQGATSQTALPDGGVPPPTVGNFELRVNNSLQAGPSTMPFSLSFE